MIKIKYTMIEVMVVIAIVMILFLMLSPILLSGLIFPMTTQDYVEFVVIDKERVGKDSNSAYLIFTESETFENSDIFVLGKFDSSDIYGQIEEGKTYRATVCGYRVGFLSMYRNIVSIKEIESEEEEPVNADTDKRRRSQ